MAESLFLESLWSNQSRPHKLLVARTTLGPCAAAGKVAQSLLSAEEAEDVERELAKRRGTAIATKHLQTFDKEMSFVASQLATPVLLCIVGSGRLLKSCAWVDHRGRHEITLAEARKAYLEGIPIVSVDAEETLTVTVRTKDEPCPKLRLNEPLAAPAAATPVPNTTEQLLGRHDEALAALMW